MPFTQEQFFEVFRLYNAGVFPWQIALHAAAFVVTVVLMCPPRLQRPQRAGRMIGVLLAVLWAWMGLVYHFGYFLAINPAARVFGLFFLVQALAFLVAFVVVKPPVFPHGNSARMWLGGALVLTGLLIYPLLNIAFGHKYFESPTFGTPCPTTIFTLGVLLLARGEHGVLWIVPLTWTVIGGSASFALGVPQDVALAAAGAASLIALRITRASRVAPSR